MKLIWGVMLALLLILCGYIYYEVEHPCIRSREYTCHQRVCRAWMTGKIIFCMRWEEYDDTCSECLERKP